MTAINQRPIVPVSHERMQKWICHRSIDNNHRSVFRRLIESEIPAGRRESGIPPDNEDQFVARLRPLKDSIKRHLA
jgi:hypothetical protein